MKFPLLCVNSNDVNDDDVVDFTDQSSKGSKVRTWYDSLRRGIRRNRDHKRVVISDPIPLSKDKANQISGVIEVTPENIEEVCNNESDQSLSNNNNDVSDSKVNASTNTEINLVESEVKCDLDQEDSTYCETEEDILNYGWYWGNISRRDAENLLRGKGEGTFLVRKSSDKRFIYSLSFRSNGRTMHTRIECLNEGYCFYSQESSSSNVNDASPTLGSLIFEAMNQNSADNIFFYSRSMKTESSLHTVSLIQPLSRFQYLIDHVYKENENGALKYLCKFIISHSSIARSKLECQLDSLPLEIKKFLEDSSYFPLVAKIN